MIDGYQGVTAIETIDGITYTSTKFPCVHSLKLLARTISVLGEHGLQAVIAMRASALADRVPNLVKASRNPRIFGALVQVAYGLGEDIALPQDLCTHLKASELRGVSAQGGPVAPAFNKHFQGELPHLFAVLSFVLAHNFAGFSLGPPFLGGSPTDEKTTEATPSSSPTPTPE